ncbi:P-selectin glycoprotein ligand 1 [Gracilinanus agilis]|uniref:P-selectin glycoprotein ligand 1 n=1 Tax=Gracilinanus agilis TaxID=191870 RepID=UPI001CFC82AC|nr:P-selectin glycoprotein ligand 1 [Gracilinanus agilis]
MSVLALFLLLALPPPGFGQPPGRWGPASENKEPSAARAKRSDPDFEDDYEVYETPTPERLDGDNVTTPTPAVVAEGTQPEATGATQAAGAPGATVSIETPSPTPEPPGTQPAAEEMTETTTEAATLAGQRTTHDVPTERGTTEAPLTEASPSAVLSPGQPGSRGSTVGAAGTSAAAIATTEKPAADPLGTSQALALDTEEPETATPSAGQPLTDSPPSRVPGAELGPNPSSPASFLSTALPTQHSEPPKPEAATEPSGLSDATALVAVATSAPSFLSGHIPVRQCLLAVLILALVATVFLICTVVLAMRLSRKGHTYPVRDYSPTEMVCISSLLADGEGPPTANGGPPGAKPQLLKPAAGSGEDCDGDDLTLHSFLP